MDKNGQIEKNGQNGQHIGQCGQKRTKLDNMEKTLHM